MTKKKQPTTKRPSNSEADFGVDAENPEILGGMASRVRDCAKMVGSGDALAQNAAIPRRTLETYLAGNAEPKLRRAARIARAAGVRLEWLATGEGPMRVTEAGEQAAGYKRVAPLDAGALQDVVQVVEEFLQERGLVLEPSKKAELLVLIYEDVREHEGKVDRARVIRLVKLAA